MSLDVNIWVAYVISLQFGRHDTAVAAVVRAVRDGRVGGMDIQLSTSTEMLGTLERKLEEKGFSPKTVRDALEAVVGLVRTGPERDEPYLLPAGRDQLAMPDREDAGVLAAAMLARVDLLVTDNLKHFHTNDSEALDTREVTYPDGRVRKLQVILHERADGVALVVGHPFDVLGWFRMGLRPTPGNMRHLYAESSLPQP